MVKIGDYCTAYEKGYFKLIDIDKTKRKSGNDLAILERVTNSKFESRKGRYECDISYCIPVSKEQLLNQVGDTYKVWTERINENF